MKTEDPYVAERTGTFPPEFGTNGLSSIFQNRNSVFLGYGQ